MSIFSQLGAIFKRKIPLPSLLDQEVPLPGFLSTNVALPGLFGSPSRTTQTRRKVVQRRARDKEGKKESTTAPFSTQGPLVRSGLGYKVSGTEFKLTDSTWVFGELKLGVAVKVHGIIASDGEYVATKITVL